MPCYKRKARTVSPPSPQKRPTEAVVPAPVAPNSTALISKHVKSHSSLSRFVMLKKGELDMDPYCVSKNLSPVQHNRK